MSKRGEIKSTKIKKQRKSNYHNIYLLMLSFRYLRLFTQLWKPNTAAFYWSLLARNHSNIEQPHNVLLQNFPATFMNIHRTSYTSNVVRSCLVSMCHVFCSNSRGFIDGLAVPLAQRFSALLLSDHAANYCYFHANFAMLFFFNSGKFDNLSICCSGLQIL